MIWEILSAAMPQLVIVVIIYISVLGIICLDLCAGIRKAKARGEYRSSFGLRRTVDKTSRYFNLLFVITIIDVMQMLALWSLNQQVSYTLPVIPLLTFIGAIFVGFIELKSVYEKNDDKEKAKLQEAAKMASHLMKNKDTQEVLSAILDYMKTDKKSEE